MNHEIFNAEALCATVDAELKRVYDNRSDPDRERKHASILRKSREASARLTELKYYSDQAILRASLEADLIIRNAHANDLRCNQCMVPRKRLNR